MRQADARLARRLFAVQGTLGAVAAASALPFGGSVAISALVGAGTCVVASALVAALVSGKYRAQEPERIVMRFFGAELAKVVAVLACFAVAYMAIDGLSVPVLLGAYLGVQLLSAPLVARGQGM